MKPLRIYAVNYRSFAQLDFTFGAGATAIVGANGSGKSSLMGAVEVALFGPRSRSLEPHVRRGTDDLKLGLMFDHQGSTYRVRRSWKNGKTTLDFERSDGHEWTPLTQGNAADTQAHIERTIGLSRSTFMASAYLAQRESDTFTAAQPRDRKRVLAEALALDDWQTAADRVASDRRAAEKEAERVDARIIVLTEQQMRGMELEAEAERLAGVMASAALLAEQADAELVAASDRLRQAEQQEAEWQSRSAALEVASARLAALKETAGEAVLAADRAEGVRQDVARLEGHAADLERLTAEHAVLVDHDRARTEALAERQRLAAERGRLERDRDRAMGEWTAATVKLDSLVGADATCDRCGQHVADEALEKARESVTAEKTAAEERARLVQQQIGAADVAFAAIVVPEPAVGMDVIAARLAELRTAPADLAAARERLATLQTLIERAAEPAFREALEQAEHAHRVAARQAAEAVRPEGTDLLRAACVSAKAAADMARQQHTNAQVEHARVVAQADQLQAAAGEHELLLAQRESLRDDLDVLAGLEQAFGRDGVPAWIVESQAVPAIEAEANRVLARLGGRVERVELRTEKETKKGDVRDALDIVCHTADGARDLATFSGGEQARAEIACALGLARLLGSRRGTDLRYLALDEPPGLDQQGTEALASILKDLAQNGGVDTVLVASHDPGLRDQFDQSVVVHAGPAGSQVTA